MTRCLYVPSIPERKLKNLQGLSQVHRMQKQWSRVALLGKWNINFFESNCDMHFSWNFHDVRIPSFFMAHALQWRWWHKQCSSCWLLTWAPSNFRATPAAPKGSQTRSLPLRIWLLKYMRVAFPSQFMRTGSRDLTCQYLQDLSYLSFLCKFSNHFGNIGIWIRALKSRGPKMPWPKRRIHIDTEIQWQAKHNGGDFNNSAQPLFWWKHKLLMESLADLIFVTLNEINSSWQLARLMYWFGIDGTVF